MKKILIHTLVAATLTAGLSGCGDSFLETKFYKGQDIEKGLTSVPIVDAALNGAYDRFYNARFAGNYALAIGDVSTDIAYWNGVTGHWSNIYGYSFLDTEGYLADIWEYGYKVIDNSTRVIEDASKLYASSTDAEKKSLDRDIAEAYALRGFSRLILTNIFSHQIKVNGKDFSDQPGILISDKIVGPEDQVKRATVGESYAAIVSDLKNALTRFTAAGGDRAGSEPEGLPTTVPERVLPPRIVTLAVVGLLAFVVVFTSLRAYLSQQAQYDAVVAKIKEASDTSTALEDELAQWKDDTYVRAQVRERLGYVMPGDTSYVVVGADTVKQPSAGGEATQDSQDVPWYQALRESSQAAGQSRSGTDGASTDGSKTDPGGKALNPTQKGLPTGAPSQAPSEPPKTSPSPVPTPQTKEETP